MRKKTLIISILAYTLLFCVTGCGKRKAKNQEEDKDKNKVEAIENMDELKDGRFYVYKGKKYYPVYMKNSSFETSDDNINTSQNDNRTLYFNDDWENIPTLYEGDSLIYYTAENLNETFVIERFEDFGYSVGLSNLERLESGRYAFSTVKEDKDSSSGKNPYINPNSNASQLFEIEQTQVIIDNIGGAQLRSGNISRGGVIIGLEKDKYYDTDVYTGSIMKKYDLKADTRMLTSMEIYSITDYTFLRSKILKINLPEYFNSGYYMVNGQGIFRYVAGKEYTDKTDFNIPNEVPEDDNEETTEEEKDINATNSVIKEPFTINEETDVVINFTYGAATGNYQIADPIVKVIGSESAYTFSEDDENSLILKAHLKAGQYTLEITGLSGRTYNYKIKKDK